MAAGLLTLVTAFRIGVAQLRRPDGKQSRIKIPFFKDPIEVEGPAWLILAAFGILMMGSPVLAAYAQKAPSIASAPISVKAVQKIEAKREEDANERANADAFVFLSDSSILDLRQSQAKPWYAFLRYSSDADQKKRTKPTILRNVMRIQKVKTAATLHLSYGTSAFMDVSCLTQMASITRVIITDKVEGYQTTEVNVDVGSVAVGSTFELIVEAIYWNAFSDDKHYDFTTYSNGQTETENLSVLLIAPTDKPFKGVGVTEFPGTDDGQPFSGEARGFPPDGTGQTYYWTTQNNRPNYYYKLRWSY